MQGNILFVMLVIVFTIIFLYLFHLVKKGFKNNNTEEVETEEKETKKPTLRKKK